MLNLSNEKRPSLSCVNGQQHDVSQEEVFRSGRVEGLADAIFEVATAAHDHLITARSFLPRVPKQAISALLPAVSKMHE